MRFKNLANIITISRIIGALLLLCTKVLSVPFFIIYTYCGISDMIDGFIARKCKTQSLLGAKLDSIADIILVFTVLIKLGYVYIDSVPIWCFILIIIICLIKFSAYIIGIIKFSCSVSLHTIANKLTGFILFCIPYFLFIKNINVLYIIACVISMISSIEELLCIILLKKYNPNVKSVFK